MREEKSNNPSLPKKPSKKTDVAMAGYLRRIFAIICRHDLGL